MGILESVRSQGERLVAQVTSELMNNPRFMQAMQTAMKGKERLDEAAARALKTMNVPTRSEFKRLQARLDAVEVEIQQVRAELRAAETERAAQEDREAQATARARPRPAAPPVPRVGKPARARSGRRRRPGGNGAGEE